MIDVSIVLAAAYELGLDGSSIGPYEPMPHPALLDARSSTAILEGLEKLHCIESDYHNGFEHPVASAIARMLKAIDRLFSENAALRAPALARALLKCSTCRREFCEVEAPASALGSITPFCRGCEMEGRK